MMQNDPSKIYKSGDSKSHLQRADRSRRHVERVIARILAKQRLQQTEFRRHADAESDGNG
jgi:hypothetical protein